MWQGPVRAVAADATGRHMVTAGADGQVKVWDARKFAPLHAYFSRAPAQWLDISQRGMLAVGFGRNVHVRALSPRGRLLVVAQLSGAWGIEVQGPGKFDFLAEVRRGRTVMCLAHND